MPYTILALVSGKTSCQTRLHSLLYFLLQILWVSLPDHDRKALPIPVGDLAEESPRLVAQGLFGALTKLRSAANDLPYTSQVALGLFGQCNAQASKVAHSLSLLQNTAGGNAVLLQGPSVELQHSCAQTPPISLHSGPAEKTYKEAHPQKTWFQSFFLTWLQAQECSVTTYQGSRFLCRVPSSADV